MKPFKGQDFYEIRQKLLNAGELFEDPEFTFYDDERISKWLRPSKISSNNKPEFSVDGFTRFDVNQGRLGDCWFLAGLSSMVGAKKFLNRVVCHDNSFDENYAEIFHFRFWEFGK